MRDAVEGRTGERVLGVKDSAPGGCERTPCGPEEEAPGAGQAWAMVCCWMVTAEVNPGETGEIFSQEPSGCRVQAPASVPHIKRELQGHLTTNSDVRWNRMGP